MVNPQVKKEHYQFLQYEHANRFASYYYQIKTIMEYNIDNILEIGGGSGFIQRELNLMNLNMHTADFDFSLKPDFVCDVQQLPISSDSYECVCAFQVLEHIPFEDFTTALNEIKRVSYRYIFISIPDASKYIKIDVNLPKFGKIKKLLSLKNIYKEKHIFKGQHYWEINKKGFDESLIRSQIQCDSWKIEIESRLFENPYHRFYLLKKQSKLS